MTDHIDHAAEASEVLRMSMGDPAEIAQVHATLALVEQQRIANLIALGQFTVVPGQMPTFRHVVFDMENGEGLSPEIRKALGL